MQISDNRYKNSRDAFFISRHKMKSYNSRHDHNSYEMLYILSGQRSFFINDRIVNMKEGDLVLISPNILHRAVSPENPGCEGILLYFQESLLTPAFKVHEALTPVLMNESIFLSLHEEKRSCFEGLFFKMLQESGDKNTGYELLLQANLIELLVLFARHLEDHAAIRCENPGLMHEKVMEIIRYINAHYMESISLSTISGMYFISRSYLSRIFKEATGFTFIEYLNCIRIKEAKKLLSGTRMKIIRISEEIGFGSVTHFGRVFKEVTGFAPLYYRHNGW